MKNSKQLKVDKIKKYIYVCRCDKTMVRVTKSNLGSYCIIYFYEHGSKFT